MITHIGGEVSPAFDTPAAINSIQMMPMVFCASFPPCPRLYAAADTSCSRRNQVSTLRGVDLTNTHDTISMMIEPRMNPSSGDTTMKITVFSSPPPTSAPVPDLATAAPTSPPISACEDDD